MKKIMFNVLLLLIVGCGGEGSPFPSADVGSLNIIVKGGASAEGRGKRAVHRYRTIVSGAGLPEPLQAEFDGGAASAEVHGIPTGEDRVIAIEALNADQTIIRSGEAAGIAIHGGEVADVEVVLQAHPIFLNVSDGNAIENTRLLLRVASDPGDVVDIQSESASGSAPLIDASSSVPQLALDISSGEGKFSPALLVPGTYRITLRSQTTEKSSTVEFTVLDGSRRRGAPLFAAGTSAEEVVR